MHKEVIGDATLFLGDCREVLRTLPDCSVNCCVTSPPYYGLRDYGHADQIGLEQTPDEYVAKMVEVFREVRRVLRDDGTLWLNLGDSYASDTKGSGGGGIKSGLNCKRSEDGGFHEDNKSVRHFTPRKIQHGLKPKDLCGIPWRVAFALQADGWYLRQDIIWAKPNPMPESVTDRCTKAHEYVFLLTKSERYFYDAEAVSEVSVIGKARRHFGPQDKGDVRSDGNHRGTYQCDGTRNRRSVWTITTKPFSGAHFAVMPPELVRPCVRAGCVPGGVVLDPFGGSGTTGSVAIEEGRQAILIELNQTYFDLACRRIRDVEGYSTLFDPKLMTAASLFPEVA